MAIPAPTVAALLNGSQVDSPSRRAAATRAMITSPASTPDCRPYRRPAYADSGAPSGGTAVSSDTPVDDRSRSARMRSTGGETAAMAGRKFAAATNNARAAIPRDVRLGCSAVWVMGTPTISLGYFLSEFISQLGHLLSGMGRVGA